MINIGIIFIKKYTSSYDAWFNKYIKLLHKDNNIIELGCGRAYTSKYLIDNGFKNIIIADLCLHYFDLSKTKYIFNEIHKVLKENG